MKKFQAPFRQETYLKRERERSTWIVPDVNPTRLSPFQFHYRYRIRHRKEIMLKLSILMVRRSDLTYEQFIEHWREVHGPLFASQQESKRYVRRYIQDHVTGNSLPGTTVSQFDGVAEIWFDDIAGAKAFFGSDGYRQNVIPDEQAFMDRKRCELLYTHEHSVMA
jgi:uncharacterized protein (TIGR02118 family)